MHGLEVMQPFSARTRCPCSVSCALQGAHGTASQRRRLTSAVGALQSSQGLSRVVRNCRDGVRINVHYRPVHP